MYSKVLVLLAFVALAQSRDLLEGANDTQSGHNIYSERHEASPAIWKQTKDLFINASEHEVISKINITDLRPDKDGDVHIASGGVGENNVTITLKSPTILRGYDFLIEVFAVSEENERQNREVVSEWQKGTQPGDVPAQIPLIPGQVPEKQNPAQIPEIPSQAPEEPAQFPAEPAKFPEVPENKLPSTSTRTGKDTTEIPSTSATFDASTTGRPNGLSSTQYPAKGQSTTEKLQEPSTNNGPTIIFATPSELSTEKDSKHAFDKVTLSTTEATVTLGDTIINGIQFPVETQQTEDSQNVKGGQSKY